MVAIAIFGALIGILIGLFYTAPVLIPLAFLLAICTAGYGLATHQSASAVLIELPAAIWPPQFGFALALFWRKRVFGRSSALLRAAQMAIGREMAKMPLPQEMPAPMVLLLGRLERQEISSQPPGQPKRLRTK